MRFADDLALDLAAEQEEIRAHHEQIEHVFPNGYE
jgi:hypothetical protein